MNNTERTEPSQYDPALTADRLDLFASLLRFVYEDAVDDRNEVKGDSTWTLGCVSFERGRAAITKAAKSGQFPWLRIEDPSKRFVFSIQGIHVRFSRGDQEGRPTGNVLENIEEESELTQQYLSIYDPKAARCVWRFVVIRRDDLSVDRVLFSLIDTKDNEVFSWRAPLQTNITSVLEWAAPTQYVKQEAADAPGVALGKKKSGRARGSI